MEECLYELKRYFFVYVKNGYYYHKKFNQETTRKNKEKLKVYYEKSIKKISRIFN